MVRCNRYYGLQRLQRRSPCIQVWPVITFELSRHYIRDLICIGSSSNALSVSTHFVSTGVTPYFSNSFFLIDFLVHSEVTQCHGNSLPVMSSKHMTSCSCSSSTSANIVCLSRLRLARPFMNDLHNLSSL